MNGPTPKQKALLEYLGISVPGTKQEAADLIDRAINDNAYEERLSKWKNDRLSLYPELYEAEATSQKASRGPALWRAVNDEVGGEGFPLKRITKAQADAAVAFLDQNFPGWDSKLWEEFGISIDALYDWFIPAVGKTAPILVKHGFDLSFPTGERIPRANLHQRTNQVRPASTSNARQPQRTAKTGCVLLLVAGAAGIGLSVMKLISRMFCE